MWDRALQKHLAAGFSDHASFLTYVLRYRRSETPFTRYNRFDNRLYRRVNGVLQGILP